MRRHHAGLNAVFDFIGICRGYKMTVIVEIDAGACGFITRIQAVKTGMYKASIAMETPCPNWQKVAAAFDGKEIDVMAEMFKNRETGEYHSQIVNTAAAFVPHISCPVTSGVLKALEVCAGLALPKNAAITFL